ARGRVGQPDPVELEPVARAGAQPLELAREPPAVLARERAPRAALGHHDQGAPARRPHLEPPPSLAQRARPGHAPRRAAQAGSSPWSSRRLASSSNPVIVALMVRSPGSTSEVNV